MVRILIADDHAVVRRGLKQIVTEELSGAVVGEARTGAEVLRLGREKDWDVVVLDITLPDLNGLEVLAELKRERPKLPVLVLSVHPEEQYAARTLRLGAAGYLTKETAPEELVTAIQKAIGGGKYISPALAEKIAFDLNSSASEPLHKALSDREYQVMCLIASGKTIGAIAEELALSVKTISTYRTRILEKMRMKNNAELTHYAIQQELVE